MSLSAENRNWFLSRLKENSKLILYGSSQTSISSFVTFSHILNEPSQLHWLVLVVECIVPADSSVWNVTPPRPPPPPMTSFVSEPQLKSHLLRPVLINYLSLHSIPIESICHTTLIFLIAPTIMIRAYVYMFPLCLLLDGELLIAGTLTVQSPSTSSTAVLGREMALLHSLNMKGCYISQKAFFPYSKFVPGILFIVCSALFVL